DDNATDFQRIETCDGQSSPVDNQPGGETEADNSLETPVDQVEVQAGGTDNKDQYVPRRTHHNQRGGGRNGGGRGNGRGYGNGRGGRSGGRGGPYQNGRNQYNDQQGNYHPRNHGGRGRGGRERSFQTFSRGQRVGHTQQCGHGFCWSLSQPAKVEEPIPEVDVKNNKNKKKAKVT
nr:hypothetical protein [Tanacetum cinerariifolium]